MSENNNIDLYESTGLCTNIKLGTIRTREGWEKDMGGQIEFSKNYYLTFDSDFDRSHGSFSIYKETTRKLYDLKCTEVDKAFDIMLEYGFFKKIEKKGDYDVLSNSKS